MQRYKILFSKSLLIVKYTDQVSDIIGHLILLENKFHPVVPSVPMQMMAQVLMLQHITGAFGEHIHCITEYYAHFPYEITIENILKSFYFDKHRSYNAITIKPKIALYLLNLETEVQGRGMILGVARPLFLEWI